MVVHSNDDELLVEVINGTMDVPEISKCEFKSILDRVIPPSLKIGTEHQIKGVCSMSEYISPDVCKKIVFAESNVVSFYFELHEDSNKRLINTNEIDILCPDIARGPTLQDLLKRSF